MSSLKSKLKRNKSLLNDEDDQNGHKSTDEYDPHLDGFILSPPHTGTVSHAELKKKDKKKDTIQAGFFIKRKYLTTDKNDSTNNIYFECDHCKHDAHLDLDQCYEWNYIRVCSQCLNAMQLSECVWKYVLASEHNEFIDEMWPWYRNCAYINDEEHVKSYEEKLKLTLQNAGHRIFGLNFITIDKDKHEEKREEHHNKLTAVFSKIDLPFFHHKVQHEIVMETITYDNIRQYRKYTAKFIAGHWEIKKNIEIIKDTLENKYKNFKPPKQEASEQSENNIEPLINPKYTILWDHWMPLLERALDSINKTEENKNMDIGYIDFKNFYRLVPFWWRFEHDVLLLELGLNFGVDTKEYLKEINDDETKIKLYNKRISAYKQFVSWCMRKINVECRLRYLLYLLVNTKIVNADPNTEINIIPNENAFGCHGIYLYDFMKDYHRIMVEERSIHHRNPKKTLTFDTQQEQELNKKIVSNIARQEEKEYDNIMKINKKYKEEEKIIHNIRDLNYELIDILQTYDLNKYGHSICSQIIFELSRKQRPALLEALGIVLSEVPTQVALEILNEYASEICHCDPEKIIDICNQIMKNTNFIAATAIHLANFFVNFSKYDLARSEEWIEASNKIEDVAIERVNDIENDYLAALMLLMPTNVTSKHESLFKTVLECRRSRFTNNERLHSIISHMYVNSCFLNPAFVAGGEENILQKVNLNAADELKLIFQSSALYYYSPQGIERAQKISYIVYVLYVMYIMIWLQYPYIRPVAPSEWLMWGMNLGYILYEVQEIYESPSNYFDNINATQHFFSFLTCIFWIILFFIRVFPNWVDHQWDHRIHEKKKEGNLDSLRNTPLVEAYMVLFAIQALLLMENGLLLFRTHPYFGIFLRILGLMIRDMSHFAFLLVSVYLGFYFAVYFILADDTASAMAVTGTATGAEALHYFEVIRGVALYLYQTLLGQQDWTALQSTNSPTLGAGRSEIALVFLAIFQIFGIIMILNLLVAVLTTSFNDVKDIANEEAAFTQTHRTYTLIYKTKTLPPPFNMLVYVILLVVMAIHGIWYYATKGLVYFYGRVYLLNPLMLGIFNQQYEAVMAHTEHSETRKYCAYCYYEFRDNDELTIDNFLEGPSIIQQSIDPSDRVYVKRASLFSNSYYCPQCYRPFQQMHELLTIQEVILNIISFYVWLIIVLPFVLLLLAIPALSIVISNAIRDAQMESLQGISHGVRRFHLHDDEIFVEDISEIPEEPEPKDDD